ncbi:MAG: hypothetical protein WCE79_06275 [Xanthobacteraceae bacterium]
MRIVLATLALAGGPVPLDINTFEPAVHVAQMARGVTDAVRKQRAERLARPHPNRRSSGETSR